VVQHPSSEVGLRDGGPRAMFASLGISSGSTENRTARRHGYAGARPTGEFACGCEQQPGPKQWVGQVLDITSEVGDITCGELEVRQGMANVEVLGDLR
jgi:hypothetical protein